MLETLAIRGYRGFESYRLTNLARVNLVVGKNNCGKTSVLEAIELLVSGGRPGVLMRSLQRRGEVGARGRDRPPAVTHIFFGHVSKPGTSCNLSSDDGKRVLSVKVLPVDEAGEEAEDWSPAIRKGLLRSAYDPDDDATPAFVMSIEQGAPEKRIVVPILEDGTILLERHIRWFRAEPLDTPVHFLTLEAFDPAAMRQMWDTILAEGRETEIVEDMRLLEPNLDSIQFLSGAGFGNGILIGVQGGGRRLPIGTYGDGMRRLLALRLSFVGTTNGFLLVDEIDTGFHWTIMEEMWQFVVEVARRLNVQVFATTHSYDCIKGLGTLLQSRPDLTDQVSIQKIHGSLKQAVCLRGDQIKVAVEQNIEVR